MSSPNDITVVGGVYLERCLRPAWNEIYGSAGRAASALASMGADVQLHTYLDQHAKGAIQSRAALEGFGLNDRPIDATISFEYDHGLATPHIYGLPGQQPALTVRSDRVLRFGLLECEAIVHGDRVVYDPQNAVSPQSFQQNGSTARELALVLNRNEAVRLTGLVGKSVEDIAQSLIQSGGAQVVIIKLGAQGALVHDGKTLQRVAAYETSSVWKIGSGDNFAAHFAYRWLVEARTAVESANMASVATAYYCEHRGFATPDELNRFSPRPIVPSPEYIQGKRPRVYLAGPFFTLAQLWLVDQARRDLTAMGLDVFSPYHDVGHGSAADVVGPDLAGIELSDIVFAIADGMDSGTIFEVGYARAKSKPVVIYCENETAETKKMMIGSACELCDDYVSAIYRTLWTACAQ